MTGLKWTAIAFGLILLVGIAHGLAILAVGGGTSIPLDIVEIVLWVYVIVWCVRSAKAERRQADG